MKKQLWGDSLLHPAWVVVAPSLDDLGTGSRGQDRDIVLSMFSQGSGDSSRKPDETVNVRRRRRSEPAGPGGRERAEAPQRRRSSGQTPPPQPPRGTGQRPRPPTSTPGGISGGQMPQLGGLFSLLGRLPPAVLIGLVVLLCIIGGCVIIVVGPSKLLDMVASMPTASEPGVVDFVESTPTAVTSSGRDAPTSTSVPFVPPSMSTEGQTWLVMMYQDADDKILEQDIYLDLNEAERVGSSDRVHIVAQVDRFNAGYQGDGDWSSTKRFYITRDDDLKAVGSQLVADLGEANMSDGQTLVDFVTWAMET
ncbi:MAG: hypothetical protein JXA89_19925, partial [Anaerolineae bacterium]|nr:hypothetical protein [Anaerolineae bacterium]